VRKIVLKCPKCKKKMKISDKVAKYRCPNCGEVYKYTKLKKVYFSVALVARDFLVTIKEFSSAIKGKYAAFKNTYKYMKSLKKNQKKAKKAKKWK